MKTMFVIRNRNWIISISCFIFILSLLQVGNAQLAFTTQEEVDLYPSTCTNCEVVDGDIVLSGTMTNFDSLSIIKQVNGVIQIIRVEDTLDWRGFNNVEIVGLGISANGFGGKLNINGFEALQKVGGIILKGYEMPEMPTFPNLEEVTGILRIVELANLVEIQGFNKLKKVGFVDILNNRQLEKISGFESLDSVNTMRIGLNPELESIFPNTTFQHIALGLTIDNNKSLESLQGFKTLTKIDSSLFITGNTKLTDVSSFNALDIDHLNRLEIYNNPMLSTCNEVWVCGFLQKVDSQSNIIDNDMGCNSEEEILEACLVDVDEVGLNPFSIYPNPSMGILNINFAYEIMTTYFIRNSLGQIVDQGLVEKGGRIDVSRLKGGIYFLQFKSVNGNSFSSQKFLKI